MINYWESFKIYFKKIEINSNLISNDEKVEYLNKYEKMDGYRIINDVYWNDFEIINFYKCLDQNLYNYIKLYFDDNIGIYKTDITKFLTQISNFFKGIEYMIKELKFLFSNNDKVKFKLKMMDLHKSDYYILNNLKKVLLDDNLDIYKNLNVLITNFREDNLLKVFKNNLIILDNFISLDPDNDILNKINFKEQFNNSLEIYYLKFYENEVKNINEITIENIKKEFEKEILFLEFIKNLKSDMKYYFEDFLNIFKISIFNKLIENGQTMEILNKNINLKNNEFMNNFSYIFNKLVKLDSYSSIFKLFEIYINLNLNSKIINEGEIINYIRNMYDYFQNLLENYFNKNKNICFFIYNLFEKNISKLDKVVNFNDLLLKNYLDSINTIERDSIEINIFIKNNNSLLNIISFLPNKQDFINKLTKEVVNFLIYEKNLIYLEYLTKFYDELKKKIGEEFTQNIELMIEQKLKFKSDYNKFKEFLKSYKISIKYDFNCFLIKKEYFNIKEYDIIKKSKQISFIENLYFSFIKINNKIKIKQKFIWDYFYGKMELKYNYKNLSFNIISQPIFAIILLEFPDSYKISQEKLKNKLMGDNNHGFLKVIDHLVDNNIITNNEDTYWLNVEYLSTLKYIPNFIYEQENLQKKNTSSNNLELKNIILEQYIVRNLKINKTFDFNELYKKSVIDIKNIEINLDFFKSVIENLIKRDFIKLNDSQLMYIN